MNEAPVEIETGPEPQFSVIWLHGLGADGHDFEPLIPEIVGTALPALRFVLPHAPYRPVTWNHGHVMRAWYDIAIGPRGVWRNTAHVAESVQTVYALIRREAERDVAPDHIFLAGFSQGGTVVLEAGLACPDRLCGVIALSAPVPEPDSVAFGLHAHLPVFMAHGREDAVVPFAMATHARDRLRARGADIEWHEYQAGHTVSLAEIGDLRRWLATRLGQPCPAACRSLP